MDLWKKVVIAFGLITVGFLGSQLTTHSINWYAAKLQGIEADQRRVLEQLDSLNTLLREQTRRIDSLQTMHPWRDFKKKK